MKKSRAVLLFLCISSVLFTVGCNNKNANEEVDANIENFHNILNEFYESNYSYRKTLTQNDDEILTVIEGERISSDYKEHVSIIQSEGGSLWTEAYYWQDNGRISAKIKTDNGWIDGNAAREYPYGYGADFNNIQYTKQGNDYIYTAEYTLDIGKGYQIPSLNAAVSQEYYIDASEQRIEKIITDLSDCNYKAGLANLMSANGCSLEDAKEQMDPDDFEQRETLEILSYDIDTIDIKW